MDNTFLQALFLGIVEGLTEFLPVSSTGHLILVIDLIGFKGPDGKVFEIVVQLGAILAICWLYRMRLWNAVSHCHNDKKSQRFIMVITLAFIPSVILGVIMYDFIKSVLFSPIVVSYSLIIGGFAILIIEKYASKFRFHEIEAIPMHTALKIGLAQTISMIPGVSRSGATIMGALMFGVDRKTAAEFSFFLAIPTMLGATTYDLYKNWAHLSVDNLMVILVGFVSAFVSALIVVQLFIRFVSTNGFAVFAYYRIIVGSLMLYLLLA